MGCRLRSGVFLVDPEVCSTCPVWISERSERYRAHFLAMPTPWRAHSDNIEGVWEGKKSQDGGRKREKSVHKVKRNNMYLFVIPSTEGRKWKDFKSRDPCFDCMQNVCDCGWKKSIQRSDSCYCHLCWQEVYSGSRTPPSTPSPSALTGPGMFELCRLARMSYLHLVTSQPEQTHNLAKFTASINSHVANNLYPVISINKHGLQSRVSLPGVHGKERLLRSRLLVKMAIIPFDDFII